MAKCLVETGLAFNRLLQNVRVQPVELDVCGTKTETRGDEGRAVSEYIFESVLDVMRSHVSVFCEIHIYLKMHIVVYL